MSKGFGSHRARKGARLATFAVAAAAFVFMASSSAADPGGVAFAVTVGKDCQTPVAIGDQLRCEFSISNTEQTSHNSLTTDQLTDTVYAPDGATVRTVDVIPINSSTPGLNLDAGSVPATCDATGCTVPFGAEIVTPYISLYEATFADYPILTDTGSWRYRNACDVKTVQQGCTTAPQPASIGAGAVVSPPSTATSTKILDQGGNAVTDVPAGSTVHDLVTVSSGPGVPAPTGTVQVDWFLNGTCTGPPAASKVEALVPGAGGASTVEATDFSQGPLSLGSYSFQASYLGDPAAPVFPTSTGACEPLSVADGNIGITPATATNGVGTNHTLTITVTGIGGALTGGPHTATASIVSDTATSHFVGGNTCTYSDGASSASCTVVISSPTAGVTTVGATSTFEVAGQSITRTTDTAENTSAGGTGDATKSWVGGTLSITPQSGTNRVGTTHTLTISVVPVGGTLDPGTYTATASITSGPGTFDGPNTCTYTDVAPSCTVVITSSVAGTTTVSAVTTASISGERVTFQADSSADKTWVDANIAIAPATALNPVRTNHTLTITVAGVDGTIDPGTYTATASLVPGSVGSFVGSPTCTYTAAAPRCTVVITSPTAGTTTVHAETTVSVAGQPGITRATGTALNTAAGGSGDAQKAWVWRSSLGSIEVCKAPDNGANGVPFTFTLTDLRLKVAMTVTVVGGTCSSAIPAPAGRWKIEEDLGSGLWNVTGISVVPETELISGSTRLYRGLAKFRVTKQQETQIAFTDVQATAKLVVCSWSSSPAIQGLSYAFGVLGSVVSAVAGDSALDAGCSSPVTVQPGSNIAVSEVVPPGEKVASVTTGGNLVLKSVQGGVANVTVGPSTNILYVENEPQ